ncbi:hypothetical protein OQA88_892 [Cercophora sp. LCS_1]
MKNRAIQVPRARDSDATRGRSEDSPGGRQDNVPGLYQENAAVTPPTARPRGSSFATHSKEVIVQKADKDADSELTDMGDTGMEIDGHDQNSDSDGEADMDIDSDDQESDSGEEADMEDIGMEDTENDQGKA